MKRFHVHVAVDNLPTSVDFYTKLFGQAPAKQRPDYAKWLLNDPRLNFAISRQQHTTGIDHFGIQVESVEELAVIKALADDASGGKTRDQGNTTCCYANSNKHWTVDPQGVAWEHFMTLSDADKLGEDTAPHSEACCIPLHTSEADDAAERESCCLPQASSQDQTNCC